MGQLQFSHERGQLGFRVCTDLLVLRQQPSYPLPDTPSPPLQGESEDCIGPPASILLVVDHIPDCTVHIYSGHTLAQPLTLHLFGGDGPNLQADNDVLAGRQRCGSKMALGEGISIVAGRMAV